MAHSSTHSSAQSLAQSSPRSSLTYQRRLDALAQPDLQASLPNIKHGVEREALRVNPEGGLALTPHNDKLGSALTHGNITTDFSESLLEFITPPETDARTTLAQLGDIHKYVQANIGEERLWPMSMPCFVNKDTKIPIARYGKSNVAKMKEVYRQGLHNRYGSMMQVIAGVHFNFSLPDDFWQAWCKQEGSEYNKETVSNFYFDLIRNFRSLSWLIPYLYGASPALCQSFLAGKDTGFDFQRLGKGTLYLPYATSLRMSDLGYTNPEQSALNICYNDLPSYVSSVRRAINTPSEAYANIAAGENGDWQQLNTNVLQIENELYSPIRPKQIARSLEKPSDALENRGVSYIEVRALDVNPFCALGISEQQFHFLDVFLLYCLLQDSPKFAEAAYDESQNNLNKVVMQGRDPALNLQQAGQAVSLREWADELFVGFKEVASALDKANDTSRYSDAVALEQAKVHNPDLTPSGQWLNMLKQEGVDNSTMGLRLAQEYKQHTQRLEYLHMQESWFAERAKGSLDEQRDIEESDKLDFTDFIADYFSKI